MNWSLKKMVEILMLENNSQKISSINMKKEETGHNILEIERILSCDLPILRR